MNDKVTNFFEFSINPTIEYLFLTEIDKNNKTLDSPDNLYTYLTRTKLISLYPINGSVKIEPKSQYLEWLIKKLLFNILGNSKAIFDINYQYNEVSILDEKLTEEEEYSILRRLVLRVFYAKGKPLLAIDPITKVYSRLSLDKLLNSYNFSPKDFLVHNRCLAFVEKSGERKWLDGSIRDILEREAVKVEVPFIFDGTIELNQNRIIPFLSKDKIASIVKKSHPTIDFHKEIKQCGEFTSRGKLKSIQNTFNKNIKILFPITVNQTVFDIAPTPVDASLFSYNQISDQSEPDYVINRDNIPQIKSKKRLAGLSKVNITSHIKEHKVVLFATHNTIGILENAISQLNQGINQSNFVFSLPKQFGIKLLITAKFIVDNYNGYERETDIFLQSNEEKHKDALVLMYLPLQSDLYYYYKAKLAHHGRVSQILSKKNFDIYIAWNLATNIFAKLGYTPWEISRSSSMPNADIVLGLAYSSLKSDGRLRRNVGYVNVFDKNGVWRFMQSDSNYLDFEKRLKIIPQIVKKAIIGYLASDSSPSIIDIHYSKKFSYQERKKTFEIIKDSVPSIQEVNFISLDKTHPLRVFDKANDSFNFTRGGIMQLNSNDFLLSVAGENKSDALTSRLLRVRVWREPFGTVDIQSIAYRILAMTKLNWRSAVRETTEPVTLKYAQEIARLTNQFTLTEWDTVNNQLSRIPWFI